MDYGESPGNLTPLVEDAHPTILQVFFHLRFSFAADHHVSNYHFWLAASFLSKIRLIRNVLKGLKRKLRNYLLLLSLRKQRLHVPRHLFLKVGIIVACLHSLDTFSHLQFIINTSIFNRSIVKALRLHHLPVCLICIPPSPFLLSRFLTDLLHAMYCIYM